MATNFVSYRTCSLGAEVSQDLLDRFSQSLNHMVGIELQMNDTSFFRYLKGRFHGNATTHPYGAFSVLLHQNCSLVIIHLENCTFKFK